MTVKEQVEGEKDPAIAEREAFNTIIHSQTCKANICTYTD